jgi:hypothetical protein
VVIFGYICGAVASLALLWVTVWLATYAVASAWYRARRRAADPFAGAQLLFHPTATCSGHLPGDLAGFRQCPDHEVA